MITRASSLCNARVKCIKIVVRRNARIQDIEMNPRIILTRRKCIENRYKNVTMTK